MNQETSRRSPAPTRAERAFRIGRRLLPPLFLLVVAVLVAHEVRSFDFQAFRASIRSVSVGATLAVMLSCLLAQAGMTAYDLLLCRWLGLRLSRLRVLQFSWVANSFNNLIGSAALTGSAIRFLVLTRAGVEARRAVTYAGIVVLAIPLGAGGLCAWVLLFQTARLGMLPVPVPISFGVLLAMAVYVPAFVLLTGRGPVHRWLRVRIPTLGAGYRAALVALSVLDWLLTALAFRVCLWAVGIAPSPDVFLASFTIASVWGMFSFIPGGLGVFDGAILLTLAGLASPAKLLSAVLLFRVGFYLVPFLVGVRLGAGLVEIDQQAPLGRLARRMAANPLFGALRIPVSMISSLGVRALSYMTFLGGILLLLAAAFPGLAVPRQVMPLSHLVTEGSQLVTVMIGTLLIALSRGIGARVRSAYGLTQALLVGGALFSLIKGMHPAIAVFLLVVSLLLRGTREHFTREGYSLIGRRSLLWLGAALVVFAGFVWVAGALHTGPLTGMASLGGLHGVRLARSLLVLCLTLLGYVAWGWFRMPAPPQDLPGVEALDRARTFLEQHGGGELSHLLFTGDKHLFYPADDRVLIQYGTIRDRLISLGPPMGDPAALQDGIRAFRDFADRYDRVPVFYQVRDDQIHLFHDLGFRLLKLGERAVVPLESFSLAGRRNQDLRTALNRGARENLALSLAEHPLDADTWAALGAISDAWLRDKRAVEKGFSVGRFERGYLERSPIALVRRGETIVAFASLLPSYGRCEELGIDLMRHAPDAPPGTMDFMFVRLIEHAREQGYRDFDLGMAPLSGVGGTRWSSRDEHLVRMVYELGGSAYNYRGLRRYKEKFRPEWRSAYLAYPYGVAVHPLLLDLAALVAGGYRHVLVPHTLRALRERYSRTSMPISNTRSEGS